MRAVLLILLLAGCASPTTTEVAEPTDVPADAPTEAQPAVPTELANGIWKIVARDHIDTLTFTAPDRGHTAFIVTVQTEYLFAGDIRLTVTSPSGVEEVLIDSLGAGAYGSEALVEGSLDTGVTMDYEPGDWVLTAEVAGAMQIPFVLRAE